MAYKPVKASYYLGIDFGGRGGQSKHVSRDMVQKAEFNKLNIETCSTSLLNANKAVVIVEIEALPHLKFSKNSIPTSEVIDQLRGLLIDNRNTVIIVGNQRSETITEWFGRSQGMSNGNHFWLAAESGYLYKTGVEEWKKFRELDDLSWINQVRKIMETYADNIDGAFIEER